jgi:DNA-binding winged helix-turn-helix (wHTH) protein
MAAGGATAGDAAASVYETVRLKPDTTCSVPSRYRWDDYVLDLDAYRLERGGVAVALEPKAFNLLAVMVQRPGHLFTKQEIFELVWPGTAVTDHALTRIVAQIRRALGDEAREARFLETVPTRGYRWIPPVETVDTAAAGVGPALPAFAKATAGRRSFSGGGRRTPQVVSTGAHCRVAPPRAIALLPLRRQRGAHVELHILRRQLPVQSVRRDVRAADAHLPRYEGRFRGSAHGGSVRTRAAERDAVAARGRASVDQQSAPHLGRNLGVSGFEVS